MRAPMHEIGTAFAALRLAALGDVDVIDADGVVLQEADLVAALESVEAARDEKVEAVAVILTEMRADEALLREEIDRLRARLGVATRQRERLSATLVQFMERTGARKVKGVLHTVWLQSPPPRVVFDEMALGTALAAGEVPEALLLPPKQREASKAAVKIEIENGGDVPWASIEDGEPTLRIK